MQAVAPETLGNTERKQVFPANGDASWRIFQALPDMVNGDATNFSFIFVSAGLAEAYRWMPDATTALIPAATTPELLRLRICVEAMFHAHELVEGGMGEAKARVIALLLATSRVAGRRAWGFKDVDTVSTQRMAMRANHAVSDLGILVADSADYGTVAQWTTKLTAMEGVYDALKDDLLAKAQQVSIGIPACNGVVIVRTLVHHYTDPHKKICDAVVDQFMSAEQVIPTEITMDDIKDILCHKSFHVIDSPRLVWMARSPVVIERLTACGQGAAVVRLPAEFDVERAAGSMLALMRRVTGAGKAANVACDMTDTEAMMTAVRKCILDSPDHKGIAQAKSLTDEFKAKWGSDMAFGAGYLAQMFEMTDAPPRSRSVLMGYAVKNLQIELGEVWAEGADQYVMARKWRKARAANGHLAGFGLMGAKKPDDFAPPEEDQKDKASK